MGAVLAVMAYLGNKELTKECPDEGDCSNLAIYAASVIGTCLTITGLLTMFTVWQDVKIWLKAAAVVELSLGLILVLIAMFMAVVTGGMTTINAESEKHFPALRLGYEQKDSLYCTTHTASNGTFLPMTDEECRMKIKDEMEVRSGPC